LPDCAPLLKDAAELELCKTAATALTNLKTAAAKTDPPEPEASLVHLAAELAYATEAASEKLRNASMERIAHEQAATAASGKPATSASAPKKPPAVPSAKAKPLSSAAAAASAAEAEKLRETAMDPAMAVMQAYSRVNRATLRYLSQFLQLGPLPTRKATFTELEALAKRKETWPALSRTLREAAMAENDPDLQNQLKTLAPKLSRRSVPVPTGALSGVPPLGIAPDVHDAEHR
jgi:hypothetical protein